MRLSVEEIAGIKSAVAQVFGTGVSVRLFGSRVDDKKRGGDIDLLVEVPAGRDEFRDEMTLLGAIVDRIGERKVDILLHVPGAAMPPIVEIAYRDGVVI